MMMMMKGYWGRSRIVVHVHGERDLGCCFVGLVVVGLVGCVKGKKMKRVKLGWRNEFGLE